MCSSTVTSISASSPITGLPTAAGLSHDGGDRLSAVTPGTEQLEQAGERDASSWGVRPAPDEVRRLSGLDLFVLWGDLGLGLLVLATGALVAVGTTFPRAIAAIGIGSLLGTIPLAIVGRAGAREGVPGMVLLRGVLGRRGSYVPTSLNVAQLIGWTAFELWAMALVASRVTGPVFGVPSFFLWLAVAATICVLLSLGGPILVVRRWLERFGVWVLMAAAAWLTVRVLLTVDLPALFSAGMASSPGGDPFGRSVDLVIAMPVSWIPLVADYNRFARRRARAGTGTYLGYVAANVWFYALGALLILGAATPVAPSPAGLGDAIAAFGGGVLVLLVLLVGETDEAFADIYSAAVSMRNAAPRLPQGVAVIAVSAVGVGLAAWLFGLPDEGVLAYEFFLLLLGSVFVPLFAVFLADYFVLSRGRYGEDRLFDRSEGTRAGPLMAWALGFVAYHAFTATGPEWWVGSVRTVFEAIGVPHPVAGGAVPASLVAFAVGFVAALALSRRRRAGVAAAPPP